MATVKQWAEGARPRTLPAAISSVLVGSGAAAALDGFVWPKALLAFVVALALQVGVNYANDYSDGIRGTDTDRVGPFRLVGSGAAPPGAVKAAAFGCFGLAGLAGLVLVATSAWWLLLPGGAAIGAAWFYTGGAQPYGYRALGEVSVFAFFGLFAVLGTTYVQAGTISAAAVIGAVAIGALACALLVANNLRDLATDATAGKRTLAVVLGDSGSRRLYLALMGVAYILVVVAAFTVTPWALLALASAALAIRPAWTVLRGATGRVLIPVLRDTSLTQLSYAILLTISMIMKG